MKYVRGCSYHSTDTVYINIGLQLIRLKYRVTCIVKSALFVITQKYYLLYYKYLTQPSYPISTGVLCIWILFLEYSSNVNTSKNSTHVCTGPDTESNMTKTSRILKSPIIIIYKLLTVTFYERLPRIKFGVQYRVSMWSTAF